MTDCTVSNGVRPRLIAFRAVRGEMLEADGYLLGTPPTSGTSAVP